MNTFRREVFVRYFEGLHYAICGEEASSVCRARIPGRRDLGQLIPSAFPNFWPFGSGRALQARNRRSTNDVRPWREAVCKVESESCESTSGSVAFAPEP